MSDKEEAYLDAIQYQEKDVLEDLLDKEPNPGKVIDDLNLLEFAFQQYDEHFEDSDIYFQNIELLLNKGGKITKYLIDFSKTIGDKKRLFNLLRNSINKKQNKAISRNIAEVATMSGTNDQPRTMPQLPLGVSSNIYTFLKKPTKGGKTKKTKKTTKKTRRN